MADKNIGLLPKATDLDDDSLLVAEQQGQAVSVTGALFKQFAKDGVAEYVDSAKTAADEAKESAAKAAEDAAKLDESVAQAAASAAAAEESNQSAQAAQGKAEAAQGASETAKEAAEAAQSLAEAAQIDARQAAAAAATSEGNAKSSETAAKDSETASKTAQEAAEAAQGKAEAASTTAAGKATEAAQSAEKAEQYSGKPPLVQGGNWWTWNAEKQAYEDTGKKAILTYDKTYASVQAMNADIQPENTVAIISSSVDDEDNAKLYISDGAKWNYLTDLSGFTGVGVAKVEQTSGDHAPGTTDVYTLTLTDGTTQTIPVYNGKNGEGSGDMEASTYDPNGKKTDVYQYADDAASAAKDAIPTKVSELENDSKYLTSESDPTVPDWAKQSEKPKYTAAEVGAVPSGQGVPAGGAEGEALVKASDKDYDTTWEKIKAGAVLTGIAITTPPTKTDYAVGESFSTAGMVVTATYDTGVTAQCTGYTYDTAGLKVTDTAVTIAYTEGGVTATAEQAITVTKAALTVPTQSGTLTYSGAAQSPSWSNYDSAKMTLGGTTTGTDAGSYSASFTPKTNYQWSDGSTGAKTATWTIGKAAGSLSLSKTSLTLDVSALAGDVAVTRPGTGAVSASSSNTSVATVSVSDTTITVTGKAKGSATITVSVAADTNYTAPSNQTISVTVDLPTETLDDNSWTTIGKVSVAGEGDLYWDVGDAKQGTFNGKVGDYLTLSNANQCVYILDFNHADGGVADKNIMWGTFMSALSGGVPTAMCDSKYSPDASWATYTDGSKTFTMNHWGNYNYGGWAGCDLRYDILGATNTAPSGYGSAVTTSRVGYDATGNEFTSPKTGTLLAAFPSDLRAVMRLREHYADSKGNSSNVAANVTKIKDAISLVMEFELFGSRLYANQYEQNQQTQFTYFKNANSKKFMKHDAVSTEATYVWLGSAHYNNASGFCASNGGSPRSGDAYYSLALVAAFKT